MSEVVTQGKRTLCGKIAKESHKTVVFLVVATRTRAGAVGGGVKFTGCAGGGDGGGSGVGGWQREFWRGKK